MGYLAIIRHGTSRRTFIDRQSRILERRIGICLEQQVHICLIEEYENFMYIPGCCDKGIRVRFVDFNNDGDGVALSHFIYAVSPAFQGGPAAGITMRQSVFHN